MVNTKKTPSCTDSDAMISARNEKRCCTTCSTSTAAKAVAVKVTLRRDSNESRKGDAAKRSS
eukprot:scaffold4779_cov116-Isochrysis_galbana.AAC.2